MISPYSRNTQSLIIGATEHGISTVNYYNKKLKNIMSEYNFDKTLVPEKYLTSLTFVSMYLMPIILTKNVLDVSLTLYADQTLVLTKKLKHLNIDYRSDQHIDLTKKLTHVVLHRTFNEPITLSKNLLCVTFGQCFNQPINAPKNLLKISIVSNYVYEQSIVFPKRLMHADISCRKIYCVLEQSQYIKYIHFSNSTMGVLETLPDGLKKMSIGYSVSKPLNNLPNNMMCIKLCTGYSCCMK